MLKHFINIIYVIITILMVACAEPYDNEISEDTYEEPVEIIDEVNEELIEIVEEPEELIAELTGIIEESIEISEDINEVAEDTDDIYENVNDEPIGIIGGLNAADRLDAIVEDVIQRAHRRQGHKHYPEFCAQHYNLYNTDIYVGVVCHLPRNFYEDYASTLNTLGNLYEIPFTPCVGHELRECSTAHLDEAVIIATIMRKLNLLPDSCDSSIGEAHVFCDRGEDGSAACANLVFEQLDETKLLCDTPMDTTWMHDDYHYYYTVNSFNGITIRTY